MVEGSISGTVFDSQGIAAPNIQVQLLSTEGKVLTAAKTSTTGEYQFYSVTFGDYQIGVQASGAAPYQTGVHVSSGANSLVDVHLALQASGAEMVVEVRSKRHVVQTGTSSSSQQLSSKDIEQIPQGSDVTLPHLLASTTPGVIQGPFGQMFIRGNHANIQYQIDGVQLPDSQTNAFGDAFTPRNVDHMEVITGGIPAEYGNRLAAVVNIVTKSGTETPGGEVEMSYGSYNTSSPWLLYGGSNESGSFHYFFSGQYSTTDRGLETPQPADDGGATGATLNQGSGGQDAVHDFSRSANAFLKLDWLADNDDKLTLVAFNSYKFYQIPNYPSNYLPTDAFFQPGFVDQFGNTNGPGQPPVFLWAPSSTDDQQAQDDAYLQGVWKHSFSDRAFLQTALYYKYSEVRVDNDPTNDLASASLIPLANPASLSENRHINNIGVKGDFSDRIGERNLLKAGYQLQGSYAAGPVGVTAASNTSTTAPVSASSVTNVTSVDNSTAAGYSESLYLQDDFTIFKPLILNVGVRADAIQYVFHGTSTGDVTDNEQQIEPRIGLNLFLGENTKLHAYYGRLFQPAPLENLRDTFNTVYGVTSNTLNFYDIKAEKDDFYELGIAQQFADHVVNLNVYYKDATDMLDDTELLNTSLAAAYNYATGYAYGVELSIRGKISSHWSDYLNYSWEIAKGEGESGGLFALPPGTVIPQGYLFLDHVQISTANAGVAWSTDHWLWSTQALFGSGLRTGPNNTLSLPAHCTFDTTLGYDFHGHSFLPKSKIALDVLNILDNAYPVTVSNGFNASHYAPGRTFLARFTTEI